MSEEPIPSGSSAPSEASHLDADLHYAPRQRRLAKLSYGLACAGPLAFWVMALAYPPTDARALSAPPVQALWWALCLCSPVGAMLGMIAIIQFRRQTLGYRRLGVGYASAGLVVGVLASVGLLLGTPVLNNIRMYNHSDHSRSPSCLSNVKQLGLGFMLYNQDYDDCYPLPKTWNEEVYPYIKNNDVFHCPESQEENLPTYAMNRRLKDTLATTIAMPARTVMLFDSIPGKNLADSKALFPNPLRHNEGHATTIGYVDGHVKLVPVEELPNLLWTPQLKTSPPASQTGSPLGP